MPLSPMPMTSTLAMSSPSGSPVMASPTATASATCRPSPRAASRMPSVSIPRRVGSAVSPLTARSVLEGGADALGLGLGHQPLELGVVDLGRLLDQHHGDVLLDAVGALEPGVQQDRLVLEVEEGALVLG